ncbi:MAG: cell wall-binding repeat-containing protein [Lachnospiraceae bacterium]|nr:cell wall-binding repeat-containing protein [Lachnospiraceae bacterium]
MKHTRMKLRKHAGLKKIGSMLLVLCLSLALLPAAVFAEVTEYDLWVNNERITSDHLTVACGEGTAVYDPAQNTLTLTDAFIRNGCEIKDLSCGIYSALDNLTIVAKGDSNYIIVDGGEGISTYDMDDSGNPISHNLSIKGDGKLSIEARKAYYGYGIYCTGDIAISDVTLDIRSGISCIWAGNNLTLTDVNAYVVAIESIALEMGGPVKTGGYGLVSNNGTITINSSDVYVQSALQTAFLTGTDVNPEKIILVNTQLAQGGFEKRQALLLKPLIQEKRLGGDNRYATAAQIAKEAFPEGADEIILVNGAKFPDALAASGYAGAKQCPLLITSLKSLKPEIKNLLVNDWNGRVKKATIIGGGFESAVWEGLNACGISNENIATIAGKDRYETAEKIYEAGINEGLYSTNSVVIATGATAADALSVSSWCYAFRVPILLAGGTTKTLRPSALEKVKNCQYITIVGSDQVVNDPAVNALAADNPDRVQRLCGNNRYETSVKIAEFFVEWAGPINYITFASGGNDNFPDALGGAMLAGQVYGPIILVSQKDSNNKPVYDFLKKTYSEKPVKYVFYLGSSKVLTDHTATMLKDMLKQPS